MLKFLVFCTILIGSSFFLAEAFSIEIEIQKESDRVIEAKGWIEPDKLSYQEHIHILIDQANSKNRISVAMMSKNPNDIRFPDYIEDIGLEPKIISFVLTNEFACAPSVIESSCIIIDLERRDLGDNLSEISANTREITDKVVGGGVIIFKPEFHSVSLQPVTTIDGDKNFVARAVYTVNKKSTDVLFNAIGNLVLSSEIKTAGGFYNEAVKLAESNPHFSALSIALIPTDNGIIRSLQVSLICSDKLIEFVRCPENVTKQIEDDKIDPLGFIETENLKRSEIFNDDFFPLNSILRVSIISNEKLQVQSMNSDVIDKVENIGDVQKGGWVVTSTLNQGIDARYIFGTDNSISKNDAIFSIGTGSGDNIEINDSGGCLIATAAFDSELAPQVQHLREIRDNTVLQTKLGTNFMTGFNQFYYSFSPTIADYERENHVFKETVKITLTPLLASLTLLQYADIDSEFEMLGYGIGVILLNIGMYFIVPVIVIMKIKKRIN